MDTTLTYDDANNFTTTSAEVTDEVIYWFYGGYVILILVVGTVQNTLTLVIFAMDKRLHVFHNFYIVGLAVADVGMGLSGHWMIIVSAFHKRWYFGHNGCVCYGFITTMFGITQISLLTSIAFDRYVVIVQPRGLQFTKQRASLIVVLCYVNGCLWASFPAFGWNSYQLEGLRIRCAIHWQSHRPTDLSFTMAAVVCVWVLPLIVIVFSYGAIFQKVNRDKAIARLRNFHSLRRQKRERKMAITVLLMIGAFFISWTPYSAVTLTVAFTNVSKVPMTASVLPALIAKTSIIWNPVIYVARHKLFRRAMVERISCLRYSRGAWPDLKSNVSLYVSHGSSNSPNKIADEGNDIEIEAEESLV